MWIFLIVGLSLASALPYHHDSHLYSGHPGRNQRIFKLLSSAFKQHPHHKHVRPGPLGPHVHYHDDYDTHYEYIRPNRPPPIPPFISGPPPSSKYLSRPPSYSSFKSTPYGSPYKSANNFRSPTIKDHFREPPTPSFTSLPPKYPSSTSFEYLPSNPSLNHVISSDDNRGPIHEIPAPNLGPKPNANPVYEPHIRESDFTSQIKEDPFIHFEKKPGYEVVESNDKVIEQPDGSKGYYAPDPDPSLPAPKVPPTDDPHSIPSNPLKESHSILEGGFPTGQEYQILEAGPNVHAPIPNLSSQELYDLMHSFPNDQYTVVQTSVLPQQMVGLVASQQPYQHHQHNPAILNHGYVQQQSNSHQEVDNNGLVHSSAVNHPDGQHYQDFTHPHYQSFNYEENNPNAAALPMDNYINQFQYDPETSATDHRSSLTVVRNTNEATQGETKKTESVKKTLPSDLSNLIPDDDFEKDFGRDKDKSPIFNSRNEPEVPFYSSLPNKETAEALATLQAAGSVASKIKRLRGDQNPEDEASEEGNPFGLPKSEISKPQQVNHTPRFWGQMLVSDDFDEFQAESSKTDEVVVVPSVPLYQASFTGKSLESADEPDGEPVTSKPLMEEETPKGGGLYLPAPKPEAEAADADDDKAAKAVRSAINAMESTDNLQPLDNIEATDSVDNKENVKTEEAVENTGDEDMGAEEEQINSEEENLESDENVELLENEKPTKSKKAEESSENSEIVEPTEEEVLKAIDVGQGAASNRFGMKIKPK